MHGCTTAWHGTARHGDGGGGVCMYIYLQVNGSSCMSEDSSVHYCQLSRSSCMSEDSSVHVCVGGGGWLVGGGGWLVVGQG